MYKRAVDNLSESLLAESELPLQLKFEVYSTSGSNLWHWNTLVRHLNLLVSS